MMKKIALAVVLSTTALSAIAEESKDFYAQVNAGYAWGMKSTASKNDFDTESSTKLKTGKSFSIGLEGGAQVNEYLRAGLSFDYMPSFKLDTAPMNFSGNTPVPASFSTSTTPATPAILAMVGSFATLYYFTHFLMITPLTSRYEKTCPLPESISESCNNNCSRS